MYKRIIIGGGAAGLFMAASQNKNDKSLIIDKSNMVGKKLLMSGAGQCNITHGGDIKEFLNKYGTNGGRIRKVLYGANNQHYINFIQSLGVDTFEREDGKVFPVSLKAEDVRSALLKKAKSNGYEIRLKESVQEIIPILNNLGDNSINEFGDNKDQSTSIKGYKVITDKGEYQCENLVIATGGRSYPATGSDGSILPILEKMGISLCPCRPALVPVYVQDYKYASLSGISFPNIKVNISDKDRKIVDNVDDLLITHKNFSGPAVINISRDIMPSMTMTINYLYPVRTDELAARLKKMSKGNQKSAVNFICEITKIPKSFAEIILLEGNIDPDMKSASLLGGQLDTISQLLTEHRYSVSGLGGYNEAMVTRGGVSLEEINLKSMESKNYPGMYFIGEVCDIDGDTGGYNLQFAYSSAVLANKNIEKQGVK